MTLCQNCGHKMLTKYEQMKNSMNRFVIVKLGYCYCDNPVPKVEK